MISLKILNYLNFETVREQCANQAKLRNEIDFSFFSHDIKLY